MSIRTASDCTHANNLMRQCHVTVSCDGLMSRDCVDHVTVLVLNLIVDLSGFTSSRFELLAIQPPLAAVTTHAIGVSLSVSWV